MTKKFFKEFKVIILNFFMRTSDDALINYFLHHLWKYNNIIGYYRTHFDKNLEDKAISDLGEYLDCNVKLKMLEEVCIFKELAFESDEIDIILKRNCEYRNIYLYKIPLM